MPLSLAKLTANRARASIDFGGGDVLQVEYYPARITSRMLLEVQQANALGGLPEAQALAVVDSATDTLGALLASWDLTTTAEDGSEQPLPLDHDTIAGLGIQIQWTIVSGLLAGLAKEQSGEARASEGSASAPPSDATSSPTAG